jgi:hypothetical protein
LTPPAATGCGFWFAGIIALAVTGLALVLFYVVPFGTVLNIPEGEPPDAHSRLIFPSVGVGVVDNNANTDSVIGLQQLGVVVRSYLAWIRNNRIIDVMPRGNRWPISLCRRGWGVLDYKRLSPRFILSKLYKSSGSNFVGRGFPVISVMVRPENLSDGGIGVWVRKILGTSQTSIRKPDVGSSSSKLAPLC